MAGRLPDWIGSTLARSFVRLYATLNVRRREVVVQNLLPAVRGDRTKAEPLAHALFANFGEKIADLLRYESGRPIGHLVRDPSGWEHFQTAYARRRGVLLLTPHLGNWEFGAPLLAERGFPLLVITSVEPREGLTELRRFARARSGIETLVIGEDPFAFVEVIRRLEAGCTVALLMDRPLPASAVRVELFGRPFAASLAAAELARATGCALLPVYLPREKVGYGAHVLPEIAYDRRALGSREARQKLTQRVMKVFEPVIQDHLGQWYHFVPIWPDRESVNQFQ
jgi:KDO2-lipid IV(A) lauroyltransferase